MDIAGRRYEVGGSIVHSANLLMVDYLDICGLNKKQGKGDEGGGNGAFSLHRCGCGPKWSRMEQDFQSTIY